MRADGATVLAQGETIRANNEAKLAIERSEELAKANVEITNQKTQTEKQLDRAESLIYSNTIQDANKFWREQRNDVALEKLNFARIDLRGWEHDLLFTEIMNGSAIIHYNCTQPTLHNTDNDYKIVSSFNDHSLEIMNSQSSNVKTKLKGHTQDVLCTNLSKNGDLLVSGSVDNTVRIWDTSTGRNLATLKGHTKPVSSVCFSHDGLKVISCSEDKTVRIWEVKSAKNLLTLKGHRDAVNCLAVTLMDSASFPAHGIEKSAFGTWRMEN
ncbi:MAG: hypothetical protein U0798_07460 [Gemmataceae bacterium]